MSGPLGEFLRARRELVSPAEAGLHTGSGLRRVPGLRREEVAVLAGISVEYYTRLERGRDQTPSTSVLTALGRVLQLDSESLAYLMTITGRSVSPAPDPAVGQVPRSLELLLLALPFAAVAVNRYGDVLVANALAQALSPGLRPGVNRLLWQFGSPDAALVEPGWETSTEASVAHLRSQSSRNLDDQRLHALVGELSVRSERFRELWARHEVHAAAGGTITVRHPEVGTITLLLEKLVSPAASGAEVLVMHPEPGSPSAAAMAALAHAAEARSGRPGPSRTTGPGPHPV